MLVPVYWISPCWFTDPVTAIDWQYLQEAAGYMKELDELESQRAAVSKSADANLEKKTEQDAGTTLAYESLETKYIYCTSCGRKATVADRFCVACGSNLHEKPRGK